MGNFKKQLQERLDRKNKEQRRKPFRKRRNKTDKNCEYMTQKYDDINHKERKILEFMMSDESNEWSVNDFRILNVFRNDGKAISTSIQSLSEKGYITRHNGSGWMLYHIARGIR